VVFSGSTASQVMTLPTASSSTGRVYVIANTGTVSISATSVKVGSAAPTSVTVATNTNLQVISDGTNWIKIN
jgi:hypothetical protein